MDAADLHQYNWAPQDEGNRSSALRRMWLVTHKGGSDE